MMPFQWDNSLLVNVPKIDRHNHHLFELLKSLAGTISDRDDSQSCEIERVFNYVVFHYACEEIWMKHTKYLCLSEHLHEHTLLMIKFTQLYEGFIKREDTTLGDLFSLYPLIMKHILKYDIEYGNFVNNNLPVQSIPRRYHASK
jgi:hemerythrin-like metal-binding protein